MYIDSWLNLRTARGDLWGFDGWTAAGCLVTAIINKLTPIRTAVGE